VPEQVYFGMCVENYHLLFRESFFDSPILSYAWNRNVRHSINEFYCEELGHDRLLLQSLQSIGLTEDELFVSVPLPQTMALCNALSYWARHDPLFFFTTLGPLEGRDVEVDSYVTAARVKGLAEEFLSPIFAHANINKNSKHGLLTRRIFEDIPVVSAGDASRVLKNTILFVSIYDRFYEGVWSYYSSCDSLLRPVSEI
jgi:heme oxygenase-like protein